LTLTLLGAAALSSNVSAGHSSSAPKLARGMYFRTLAPGARLPRRDTLCARLVTHRRFEPRPDNYAANHTVPSGPLQWPTGSDQMHWRHWVAKRSRISGHYTGSTDAIIRWAACKWGLDENLLRAVAVQESYWHQSTVGDSCGRAGQASYGLLQVKNAHCDGSSDIGGYPWTQRSTAFAVDTYGAWIRSCLNGDFYDGGDWLYGGKRVRGDTFGCVGAWYSGDWYSGGAQNYIAHVKRYLADKEWRHLGH